MSTNAYFSYLIRIWQNDDRAQRAWLASLEDPTTQQLTCFQTLDELFAFIQKQTRLFENKTIPIDDASEGHNRQLVA